MAWQRFYGRRRGNAECLFFTGAIRRLADRHLGVGFDQLLVVGHRMILNWIFTIAFSMLMAVSGAVRQRRALLCPFCASERATNKRDIRVSTANGRMVLTVTMMIWSASIWANPTSNLLPCISR